MNRSSKLVLYIVLSVLLHSFIFGFDQIFSLFFEKSKFSTTQAPSSIRVVVKEQKKIDDDEEVVIEEIQPDITSMVLKKKKKEKKKPELQKPQEQSSEENHGSQWDEDPSFIQNPAPGYPEMARRMNWQGVVYLRIVISATGAPVHVEVAKSSGYRVLDESAMNTIARRWKFAPAKTAGISIESTVILPIRFQLTDTE